MNRATTFALAGFFAAAGSAAVLANDTGFAASTHDLRREGGRLCQVDHFHGGSASAGTKRVALNYALKIYYDNTAGEYGTDWGSWGKAANKSIKYDKTTDGWTASVQGRPCK